MANKTISDWKVGTRCNLVPNFPLLLCCALMLVQCETNAQKPSKYYVTYTQPDGSLYFIQPQTVFSNPETKTDFILDVTYLNSKDSATFSFTFFDKDDLNLETITVAYGDWQYQSTVKRIYVDGEKKLWRFRYTFNIPFDQLVRFYRAKEPVITLTTDTARAIPIKTTKQWGKNAEINQKIMQIIQINKQ